MDEWFSNAAYKNHLCGACKVHVCENHNQEVTAFFALTMSSIPANTVPRKFSGGMSSDIPAILLSRIAVSQSLRGNGIGIHLLNHALKMSVDAANVIGARLIYLDAKNEKLACWYENYGFKKLSGTNRLALKMSDAKRKIDTQEDSYFVF